MTRRAVRAHSSVIRGERGKEKLTRKPTPAPVQKKEKTYHSPEIGARLRQAADNAPHVPAHNYGRLPWIQEQLISRWDDRLSEESIRKYLAGEARPTDDRINKLALLFGVDPVWLMTGRVPELDVKQAKLRNAMADGAVNVLAGLIAMAGGHPAFPSDKEVRKIDLIAIIKGVSYNFHVVLGSREGDNLVFPVPTDVDDTVFILGAVAVDGPGVHFFEIPHEMVAPAPSDLPGAVRVRLLKADAEKLRVKDFSQRL